MAMHRTVARHTRAGLGELISSEAVSSPLTAIVEENRFTRLGNSYVWT